MLVCMVMFFSLVVVGLVGGGRFVWLVLVSR